MQEGYLAIILHAHLPFIRRSQAEKSLEERWLHEAITESYIPLLLTLETLLEEGIDFRVTFSISPPLAAMLGDPVVQTRYVAALESSIELSEKEEVRTRADAWFHPLARMYHALYVRAHDAFVNRYHRNLLNGFLHLAETGKVDLITTAATHGYLPLLSSNESAVRAQIRIGVEHHEQVFGRKPRGLWLPECGYYPGVDEVVREQRIDYTILETHGITRASSRPRYGVYAPIITPAGLAAFGRDPDSSRQVWSSSEGYPGDYDYREFYRDIGHDLDLEYIRPYILPDDVRVDTGIKYFRITGKGSHKDPYVPEWAERKAEIHAEHFIAERLKQFERLASFMDRKPIVVAPYDAELFGHWWFEGPLWLNHLIRKTAAPGRGIRLVTPAEYLDEFPVNQSAEPCMSSWGSKGFNEVWLNDDTQWIYPHLDAAAEIMTNLVESRSSWNGLRSRALNQAARELLLAQSSDWAFMITSGGMKEFAASRTREHLLAFNRICEEIAGECIDGDRLKVLEARDDIFNTMSVAGAFRIPSSRTSKKPRGREGRIVFSRNRQKPPAGNTPLHIVMVCPELMPFAKTGGLADMVSSLAMALDRLGQHVTLVMPAYRSALNCGVPLEDTGVRLAVSIAGRTEEAQLLTAKLDERIPVYLIRADRYFNRDYLYATPDGDYSDNVQRFSFFARAVLELFGYIDLPDILHAHDWQAALTVALLKTQPERYPGLASIRTVFTVHNLGYQGLFPAHEWPVLGLEPGLFNPQCLEFYGMINFMKSGLIFADALTTVSASYAREIQTAEYGFGLEGIFKQRAGNLTGILNGAGYDVWNPAGDAYIVQRYTMDDLSGKKACKQDLQSAFGIAQEPDVAVIGAVSRMASQKGFDLIEQVLDTMLQRRVEFVLLGTGDKRYQDYFAEAARRYAGRCGVRIAYEEALAHKTIAGADMFLMPSQYEPSGLTQLYSLKYGTIPIVRATGGLKDSIEDFDPATGKGAGFRFEQFEGQALMDTIDRALDLYADKAQWHRLMRNAMQADFSWDRSARQYLTLYRNLSGRDVHD
jgi:1,4-alpha-glucan branching enzyme